MTGGLKCLEETEQDQWDQEPEPGKEWVEEAVWDRAVARGADVWAALDSAPEGIVSARNAAQQHLTSEAYPAIK